MVPILFERLSLDVRQIVASLDGKLVNPVIVNRLTVDGRDYFLPDPITELKGKILEAIKAGGGYVNIPPLRSGPGIDILFSPGMPVVWTQIEVGGDASVEPDQGVTDLDDEAFASL